MWLMNGFNSNILVGRNGPLAFAKATEAIVGEQWVWTEGKGEETTSAPKYLPPSLFPKRNI